MDSSYESKRPDPIPGPLDEAGRLALASQLGERPETTISLHALYSGEGAAHVIGEQAPFRAALVTWSSLPDWPHGYGEPDLMVDLLASRPSWGAVCVVDADAAVIARTLAKRTGRPSSCLGERFYVLDKPTDLPGESPARELGPDDLELLEPTAAELDIADPRRLLEGRIVAGVVDDRRVVAAAHNGASSRRFGDVGVATIEGHRRRGYGSACARLVAQRVIDSGRTPVWCTNDDNVASQETAASIGFRQVARRQNVFLGRDAELSSDHGP